MAIEVQEGLTDPLVAYAHCKAIEKQLKETLEIVYASAIQEAEKYPPSFEHEGFKFQRKNGRTMYDFSGIESINEAKRKVKELESLSKQALSAGERGSTIVDDETGEVITPPKVKFTKDTLSIK